jgi:hypothetical protein
MDGLPLDMSHPAVRDYMSLVRLQVLTPLSLLINIAAVTVCATIVNPSIRDISRLKPTSISPSPTAIAIYVAAIYITQIGYCLLLVLASKPETKRALTKGVGLSLVFANWVMALWAVSWILQFFLIATILQGLLLLLLIYSNIALLVYHPPTHERPVDTALIHAPLRFFLVLPLSILFPLCLLYVSQFSRLFPCLPYQHHPRPRLPPHPRRGPNRLRRVARLGRLRSCYVHQPPRPRRCATPPRHRLVCRRHLDLHQHMV